MAHVALIIDDNSKNLSVLQTLLAKENIDAISVDHPHDIETVVQGMAHVDLVFLDLEMPEIDGYDVLADLRSNPLFDGVPIVAYTVHVSEIDTAYTRGFDSFIGKPLDSDIFPEQIERILAGEGVWET